MKLITGPIQTIMFESHAAAYGRGKAPGLVEIP